MLRELMFRQQNDFLTKKIVLDVAGLKNRCFYLISTLFVVAQLLIV